MFNFRKTFYDTADPYGPKPPSRFGQIRRVLILLIVGFVLVATGLGVYNRVRNNPGGVSKRFVQHLKDGKTEESYALGSASFRFTVDKDDWKNEALVYQALFTGGVEGGNKGELKDFSTTNTAEARVYTIAGDDANYTVTVIVESIDGNWQVSKFLVDQKSR